MRGHQYSDLPVRIFYLVYDGPNFGNTSRLCARGRFFRHRDTNVQIQRESADRPFLRNVFSIRLGRLISVHVKLLLRC